MIENYVKFLSQFEGGASVMSLVTVGLVIYSHSLHTLTLLTLIYYTYIIIHILHTEIINLTNNS